MRSFRSAEALLPRMNAGAPTDRRGCRCNRVFPHELQIPHVVGDDNVFQCGTTCGHDSNRALTKIDTATEPLDRKKKRNAESKAPPMVSKYIVPERHIEIYEADIQERVTRRVTPIECAGMKIGEVN